MTCAAECIGEIKRFLTLQLRQQHCIWFKVGFWVLGFGKMDGLKGGMACMAWQGFVAI